VLDYASNIEDDLEEFRVHLDDREERNPGFKFNEWELKGVPLRIEIGPNEVEEGSATLVHRPDGEQETVDRDGITGTVRSHLDAIYDKLYAAAEENLESNIREADSVEEILGTLGRYGGYVKTAWCGDEACETVIKDEIAADIVMVPLDETVEPLATECGICGDEAVETAYFARNY
jgi:prolyl-tRNA synthetase